MKDKYRILHLEDVSADAELVKRELTDNQISFDYLVINTELQYITALNEFQPDVILSDHSLPCFNSFEALAILKTKKLNIPFIVITSAMTEDVTTNLVWERADDYILKDRLHRLPYVVLNAINKYRFEKERKQFIDEACEKEAAAKAIAIQLADKLLLATQTAGIGIWEYLFHEKKFIADDVLLSLYGITSAEFAGTYESWIQYVHPGDKEKVNREFRNALASFIDFDTEFRNIWPDGSIHFIKGVAKVQRDSEGKPISFIGTNQDITESKKANPEMQRLANRLQLATDSAGIGVWDWDLESGNLKWDSNMHRIYNIDDLQFGSIYEGWLLRLHPEDKLRVNEEIQMAIAGTKEYNTEFRIVLHNSSVRYIRATGKVERDQAGKALRMIGTNQDISISKETELVIEESEKRYRQIVETAQEGIWMIDENNLTNFVNPKMVEMIGYSVTEIMGRAIQDFMDDEERSNSYQQIERRKKGISENHSLNFITKNGRSIRTNISTNPILDSDGKYKGALAMITDITENIAWQEALKESEKKYRQIVETAQEGVWMIDENFKTTFVNNKLCEIIEYPAEEIIGQEVYYFMDEEGKRIAGDFIQQKKEGDTGQAYLKYISKSGKAIWANVSANPLFNEDGTYKGAMAMITDITKRKQAEENNLFQAELLNNIGQAVMALDLNGIISYWNKAAEKIFGWTAEEAIGDHILSHGPAQQTKEQATEIFTELHQGKSWTGELEMLRKDGTTFTASVTDSPVFDHDNKLCGIIGIASDITERKTAEENFREMQEQLLASQRMAHVGSWHRKIINAGDIKSNPMVYSEESLRILGLPLDTSDMSYEKFLSMVHPEDAELVNKASQEIFDGHSFYYKIDHRMVLLNGAIKWVSRDAKVIKDAITGQSLKIIGTIRDITIAKEQEIELQKNYTERAKMVSDLLIRNKDLEQFTYIVSHNLRAPVANIVGVAGIINDSGINAAEREEMINGLIASVERLDMVVNDLNHILQVKQDYNEIKEKVSFSKLVTDILRSIDHIITKEIKVAYDFSEIDEFVTVKSYLYSIFYNLVSNSIKYRQPQVPCIITIKSYFKNNTIKLTFTDNGLGIDLTQRGKEVFGLYKRFHKNIEGKGMGLFMVKTQAEFLGGQITIESEVNKGTTFIIEFKSHEHNP